MTKESKQFTQEEVNSLQEIQKEMDQIIIKFGQISINKEALKSQEVVLREQLTQLKVKEQNLAKTLSDKYGKGTFDLETNKFNPAD